MCISPHSSCIFFFFNCDTDYTDPAFRRGSRTRQHLSGKRGVLTAHKNGNAVHEESTKTNAASTVIRSVQKEGRDQTYGHLYKRKIEIRSTDILYKRKAEIRLRTLVQEEDRDQENRHLVQEEGRDQTYGHLYKRKIEIRSTDILYKRKAEIRSTDTCTSGNLKDSTDSRYKRTSQRQTVRTRCILQEEVPVTAKIRCTRESPRDRQYGHDVSYKRKSHRQ